MIDFQTPIWVSRILEKSLRISEYSNEEIEALQKQLAVFSNPEPLISVVIPAWNEEEGILHTLLSLANTNTKYPVELIIVDNNSTDGTAALLQKLGVQTLLETKQGVGHARTAGMHHAKGKYILTGDSDTLYPPGWITAIISNYYVWNIAFLHPIQTIFTITFCYNGIRIFKIVFQYLLNGYFIINGQYG